ncbi:MAG: DMT family transporter [Bilophila sp.]
MDFIEPAVALNIYQNRFKPALRLDHRARRPAASVPRRLRHYGSGGPGFHEFWASLFAVAGVIGCITYLCWYKAMNMTGVSRAMALNITYALWGVVFSALFTDAEITRSLVIGAAAIFAGMCLVIGNPRDIVNLRNVQ